MDEEILESLYTNVLNILEIKLMSRAARTIATLEEYIQTRLIAGAEISTVRTELLKDLNEGGRIFGEFRNQIRATAHGNNMRISDSSQFAEQGMKVKYRWVAVLVNTCPDCIERHGQIKQWDVWEEEGIPRSGHTVCGENCRCVLLPANVITEVLEPIQRG